MSIKRAIADGVADMLGTRAALPLTTALAKAGLRGLGVNISYDFDKSGEAWLLKRIFSRIDTPKCLDIGANVGEFTLRALTFGAAEIVAFEPVPTTFAVLSDAVGGDRRATLIQSAVGTTTGQIDIFVPTEARDSVLASLDPSLIPGGRHVGATAISVPITSLDDCPEANTHRFDVMKIDVEGFELEVLIGAKRMIETMPPKLIQFEFNSHHAHRRHTLPDFAAVLPGYKLFRLAASSLRPLDVDHYLSTIYTYQNIVCVLESELELVA